MSARAPEFVSISPSVLRPRLPRIGNIKIGGLGAERTSGGGKKFRLPEKYDHFKVTLRARDNSGNFVLDADVHAKLPEKPRSLNVVLMFDEPQHNWQYSFVAYDGKKLRCQGNGERAYDRVLGREIPCTCPLLKVHEGDYPKDIKRPGNVTCKPYGVLSVLLPDAETYGGFYVFRTTSWEMISSITASLQLFYQQFGGLAFLPLRLELNPVLDTYEEGGQTKTSTTWKASLVLAGSIDTAFQLASGAQEQRQKLLQLSAGSTYTPEQHVEQLREIAKEDEGEVAQEYYGDTQPEVQDAEYEIETEMDPLERHIRYACEIAGADPIKVNQSIVAHEGRLVELAEKTQKLLADKGCPEAWDQAKARIEAEAAAEEAAVEIVDDQQEEAGEPAPDARESLDLFS